MPKSIPIDELREKIKPKHVESAMAYIREKGDPDVNGILTLRSTTQERRGVVAKNHKRPYYAPVDLGRLAYLFALKELGRTEESPPFPKLDSETDYIEVSTLGNLLFGKGELEDYPCYNLPRLESTNTPAKEGSMTDNAIELLRQFYQIIFYGPPGTGKTYCAKQLLPKLLNVDEDELDSLKGEGGRWDIVQFHPSYNYEDFVRGVQVKTEGGHPVYETLNRTFGDICNRADDDSDNNYALIIDEINRANVSAVLGELIYGLEYRGESVKTPYKIKDPNNPEDEGDSTLVIPENLYVIGTMNTADRTIGQIDYAVRRRFAFVGCPPDEEIISKHSDADDDSLRDFRQVNLIFDEHTSPDFDAADVRIGHSYFLAKGRELANRIYRQVVPILREYVKDGVLKQDANSAIGQIETTAVATLNKELAGKPMSAATPPAQGGSLRFYWKNGRDFGFEGVGRTALGVIKHFIAQNPDMTLEKLIQEFDSVALGNHKRVLLWQDAPAKRYFPDRVSLEDGSVVAISKEWGATGQSLPQWDAFKKKMAPHGYSIGHCHIVNIGEGASRSWKDSRQYGFISAGGTQSYHTQINNLRKGDFIFAKWAQDAPARGCVACGEVTAEAVPIAKFKTADDKMLIDCKTESGEKFRDKYRNALEKEFPDLAVAVEWRKDDHSENPIHLYTSVRQFRAAKIDNRDWLELRRRFNILGETGGY